MMTIKQVLSTGCEFVFEATRVNYQPINNAAGDRDTLFVETKDDSYIYASGIYYIMNEAGRTVAKYDLGPEPI